MFNRREAHKRNQNLPPVIRPKVMKEITGERVVDEGTAQPHHIAISVNGVGLTQEEWNALN